MFLLAAKNFLKIFLRRKRRVQNRHATKIRPSRMTAAPAVETGCFTCGLFSFGYFSFAPKEK